MDRQTGDLISLLSCFESRLKSDIYCSGSLQLVLGRMWPAVCQLADAGLSVRISHSCTIFIYTHSVHIKH
jgi:hypothetical protein